jgi:hypothetical protein
VVGKWERKKSAEKSEGGKGEQRVQWMARAVKDKCRNNAKVAVTHHGLKLENGDLGLQTNPF